MDQQAKDTMQTHIAPSLARLVDRGLTTREDAIVRTQRAHERAMEVRVVMDRYQASALTA
jgi:hypothetical protein